jgi:predicted small lipoprotein YifL
MLNVSQILVSAIGLAALGVGLAGCGQRGPLYLPNDPAAASRATLPELMLPVEPRSESTTVQPRVDEATTPPAKNNNSDSNPTGTTR